ncbi:GyrI-like domain-containing protein [Microbacterium sp. p3-SID336]|uniref:GyrI-like domain-containing protein n=1 Tax=Microbacterium sp. p3-SID336 TaxID=2916212 RepID=UPI0021A8CEC2|nr:GyrI-like domain-containing protein [Microbacterium sp. p3-SID336]MCT1478579.1 GyrI-like domain-containing protein [Microbacterium sp. p3-SID336]
MNAFPDAPFGPADSLELDPVPLAVIRHEGIRIADLRDVFDGGYAAIGAAFAAGTLIPTGPALAIYHGDPMGVFDLELGFPVHAPPTDPIGTGEGTAIVASTLPTGPAVATTVLGSYDGLGAGWAGLVERAADAGLHPRGVWIEVYVSDPSTAPEELRTDLLMPVA